MGDLLHPKLLAERIQPGYDEVKILLGDSSTLAPLASIAEDLCRLSQPLLALIGNAQDYLWKAWRGGESILFEGAQATLLDIDHGTYPYVTSSNCSIGGLFTGTGLPPKALDHVLGVAKAYTTRVGAGPFPSELLDATGELLRQVGHEFGTTTGRPRRCGWFDAVITRHACRTNGADGLGIMKLDVMDGFKEVGMVIGYRDGEGSVSGRLPACAADWDQIQPVVKMFKGWAAPTRGITNPKDLPAEAREYLAALSAEVETPIAYLSTGPDRSEGYVPAGSFLEPLLG
jgi:adenylosuccinate synthase